MADDSEFGRRIRTHLDEAAAKKRERQNRVGQQMSELMQREVRFAGIAKRIMTAAVLPRLEELAGHFDNASVSTSESARCCRVHFDHTDRFPATVDVQTTLLSDESMSELTIVFGVQILPVFIKYENRSELTFDLEQVDDERVATWLEDCLVQFVQSYVTIEDTEQYHQDNMAIDPVCGMQIHKRDAFSEIHGDLTFYFCAAICRDKFVEAPDDFLPKS